MADIELSKKDEAYLKVRCEPSIGQELNDHFSFDVPGAKFHPLYKSRMWDGKVRLYSMFTQELYVGLKSYLERFCEERDYVIDYSNYVEENDAVTYDIVRKFCEDLNVGSKVNLYKLGIINLMRYFKQLKMAGDYYCPLRGRVNLLSFTV